MKLYQEDSYRETYWEESTIELNPSQHELPVNRKTTKIHKSNNINLNILLNNTKINA